MNQTILSATCAAIIIALFFGCAQATGTPVSSVPDYITMETVCTLGARGPLPKTLAEIGENSSCIVEGKLLHSKPKLTMDVYEGKPYIAGGLTISTMEILKVHHGALNSGDTINFVEPYYIDDASGTPTIVHQGNALPAVLGERYLFFLRYIDNAEGRWYSAQEIEYGRYPVVDDNTRQWQDFPSATNRQLELCERADSEQYREFYQEAIDKYMSD